ncbi:MAG TPA: ImmA/IrrE family metallo-endopeptidase [Rhizomicrobium sp.]|nr:ImmA/IrrE family metallo-endopeptidase [Rhizomicrobium sp.]
MSLSLDRMALDDVGAQPQRIAEAILGQLDYQGGRVAIHSIARALDIDEIRTEPLDNLEGALLTTADRNRGSILVNSKAGPGRQRFTIGHELGHFLIPSHMGSDSGFHCSRSDMQISSAGADETRKRQESEANRFAIEILAPRRASSAFLDASPDIAQILAMAEAFAISRAAAARRFVELHDETVAIVFSKKDRVTYAMRSEGFPLMAVRQGELLGLAPQALRAAARYPVEDADASFWLSSPPRNCELSLQTLYQKDDYAMSLLHLVTPDEETQPDLEDVCDRFAQFNDR